MTYLNCICHYSNFFSGWISFRTYARRWGISSTWAVDLRVSVSSFYGLGFLSCGYNVPRSNTPIDTPHSNFPHFSLIHLEFHSERIFLGIPVNHPASWSSDPMRLNSVWSRKWRHDLESFTVDSFEHRRSLADDSQWSILMCVPFSMTRPFQHGCLLLKASDPLHATHLLWSQGPPYAPHLRIICTISQRAALPDALGNHWLILRVTWSSQAKYHRYLSMVCATPPRSLLHFKWSLCGYECTSHECGMDMKWTKWACRVGVSVEDQCMAYPGIWMGGNMQSSIKRNQSECRLGLIDDSLTS